jgi:hypothetical protein
MNEFAAASVFLFERRDHYACVLLIVCRMARRVK